MQLNLSSLSFYGLLFANTAYTQTTPHGGKQEVLGSNSQSRSRCPLPEPHAPSLNDGHVDSATFWSNGTLADQIERLSAVVAVPSVCFDDLGDVDQDDRWEPFQELHNVLERLFPLV